MADLTGKVAIITGAASGIGAETVRLFLEAGANVVAVDRQTPPVAAALVQRFAGQLRGLPGDVADETTAKAFTDEALSAFGRIDILVNNAGIAVIKPLHEHTPEEWDRVMNVNVKSIYWGARHVIPVMKRQGGGVILNTGSISSVAGMLGQGAYAPSKGAVVQMTRQMAVEYAADHIRVNAVCPGTVDTPLVRKAAADSGDAAAFMKRLGDGHPIGRIAEPVEIAHFFRFLASDDARFITGAVLMIDGGYTAQ
jgi:NAD(P)-dependent dehydrogenase (short-subunit alcohol dehydrogenase family)